MLFRALIAEQGDFNKLSGYWERGNKNEIDLVGINDLNKKVMVAEVKLNAKCVRWHALKDKVVKLTHLYFGY